MSDGLCVRRRHNGDAEERRREEKTTPMRQGRSNRSPRGGRRNAKKEAKHQQRSDHRCRHACTHHTPSRRMRGRGTCLDLPEPRRVTLSGGDERTAFHAPPQVLFHSCATWATPLRPSISRASRLSFRRPPPRTSVRASLSHRCCLLLAPAFFCITVVSTAHAQAVRHLFVSGVSEYLMTCDK